VKAKKPTGPSNPRERDYMRKARQRGRIFHKEHADVEADLAERRAVDERVARNVAWSRRQYVLNRPDISETLKQNLLTG